MKRSPQDSLRRYADALEDESIVGTEERPRMGYIAIIAGIRLVADDLEEKFSALMDAQEDPR